VGIAIEAFALFIRFWLNSTASLAETAQAAARAKGGERYDKFLEALGRRLANGPQLRQDAPEDVEPIPENITYRHYKGQIFVAIMQQRA
jgi:hypothetical protein